MDYTKFVGLDVHKKTIAVAIAATFRPPHRVTAPLAPAPAAGG